MGLPGELPGVPNSYIALAKSENDQFVGALTIKDKLYEFQDADMLHVAASVGVALDIDVEPINEQLKTHDLSELGKSIDLLVKYQIIKQAKASRPKIPVNDDKSSYLKLSKGESAKICTECDQSQFRNDKFTGCLCLNSLAKGIKTAQHEDGYLLQFNLTELDDEAIATVVESFKD